MSHVNETIGSLETQAKPVIGLMGGPGSGKSTVARLFQDFGCEIIDADKLAHDAIQSGPAKQQLRVWWGDRAFDASGNVDRQAVGQIVFNDAEQLRRLEALVHPLVSEGRKKERGRLFGLRDCVAVVEDCPLLLETGLDKQCDWLVLVDTPDKIRLSRVRDSRGWDEEELKKRDQRQLPLDIKRQAADYVIRNDQTLAQVREQVRHVLQNITDTTPP